jgi:hypothetical protein
MRKLIVAGMAAAAAVSLAACKTTSNTTSSSNSSSGSSSSSSTNLGPLAHAADIHIDACTVDATLQAPVAHLTVTNNSSKPSDYSIAIAFEDPAGNQLDTGNAFVQALQPHQSTKTDASSLKQGVNTTGMTCKLVQADRTSAVG